MVGVLGWGGSVRGGTAKSGSAEDGKVNSTFATLNRLHRTTNNRQF